MKVFNARFVIGECKGITFNMDKDDASELFNSKNNNFVLIGKILTPNIVLFLNKVVGFASEIGGIGSHASLLALENNKAYAVVDKISEVESYRKIEIRKDGKVVVH